ncbi:Hpt domain-containing protein [Pseudarthrobacter equi]|uniref:Hpt domain-containing protein n=2 Tax=Pseudarthrobacter equi TaxID=728066 RepID=A0A1H2B2E8_9MICC|nr:Hpt domain-containing protein [Pseudarthrobacter equi]
MALHTQYFALILRPKAPAPSGISITLFETFVLKSHPYPKAVRMTPMTSPSHEFTTRPVRTLPAQTAQAERPLVDHLVLERLREELEDDRGYTRVFVADFVRCLPGRIERLRHALTTGDWAGSFDTVLSLKTSSQMVGAEQLASLAADLEAELRSDATTANLPDALPQLAAAFLAPILRCSTRTRDSLASRYPVPFRR